MLRSSELISLRRKYFWGMFRFTPGSTIPNRVKFIVAPYVPSPVLGKGKATWRREKPRGSPVPGSHSGSDGARPSTPDLRVGKTACASAQVLCKQCPPRIKGLALYLGGGGFKPEAMRVKAERGKQGEERCGVTVFCVTLLAGGLR